MGDQNPWGPGCEKMTSVHLSLSQRDVVNYMQVAFRERVWEPCVYMVFEMWLRRSIEYAILSKIPKLHRAPVCISRIHCIDYISFSVCTLSHVDFSLASRSDD